ncbi:MAG: hypothetical protein LAT82_02195 [Nanoarchaeota archaeon]|nr:hypothetical protein [Nanoarchaeota archaeon]
MVQINRRQVIAGGLGFLVSSPVMGMIKSQEAKNEVQQQTLESKIKPYGFFEAPLLVYDHEKSPQDQLRKVSNIGKFRRGDDFVVQTAKGFFEVQYLENGFYQFKQPELVEKLFELS